MTNARRICALALMLCVPERIAAAEWLLTPIAGATVRSTTGFLDLDATAGDRHVIYGVSVMRFPDRVFGIDAEVTIAPSFFTGHQLVESSRVITATVGAVITIPRTLLSTLRPYAVVGIGLVRASSSDLRNIFPIDSTLPALRAGAGVLVPISRHIGIRADGTFTRTSHGGDGAFGTGSGFLEIWRIAAGVSWSP